MAHHRHRRKRPHHQHLQTYFSAQKELRVDFFASEFVLGPASNKGYWVYLAIESQLEAKGFNLPHDDSWSMKDGYGYSETEMRMMLVAISADIATHGLKFKISDKFIIEATKGTLEALRTAISDRTKP